MQVIQALRERIAPYRAAESLAFSRYAAGIPKGAITEVSGAAGSGKTELMLKFIAENARLRVAWIEEQFSVYPRAFPQQGVALKRVLFVEAGEHALWAAQQILRSRVFKIVLLSADVIGEMNLRRLQLATRDAAASLILIREAPIAQGAWPISLKLQVRNRHLCNNALPVSL